LIFLAFLALAAGGRAQTNPPPAPPRISALEASNYLNQQVVVVDKVAQVALRSNIWLLHLNQKYPKSPLNAVIRKGCTNYFPDLNRYLGQQVELAGRITELRGRLELVLTNSDQIKILSPTPSNAALASPQAGPLSIPPTTTPSIPQAAIVRATPSGAVAARLQADSPQAQTLTAASSPPASAPGPAAILKGGNQSGLLLPFVVGLLAAVLALLAAGVFVLWRRQQAHPRALPSLGKLALPEDPPAESSADDWKQRALAAEAMAGRQGQVLRERMIPELAEFAKQSLVQGLFAQRNALLETQLKAQHSLAELEGKLKALQAPLQERIRFYEERILELERQVELQGEEVRELNRATLVLLRRKLEDERASERLQSRFN
jgi:hypothetical protein